jgi:hypothetical protein
MKLKSAAIFAAIMFALGWRAGAQTYDTNGDFVQTFAGSSFSGYLDGQGTQTMFNAPALIVSDSQSNLFVLDLYNYRIRKITPTGMVTTFAGGGTQFTGIGTNVNLGFGLLDNQSISMSIDHNNTIWLLDKYLYEITSDAVITTNHISGNGICIDSGNNIYLSIGNQIYRYTTNGVLSVFAGSGNSGYEDGNGIFTDFDSPAALACDEANNIYVWDSANNLIRKIDQSQNVTTFAGELEVDSNADGFGTNASFNSISQMCFDNSGNLYLACGNSIAQNGNCIRKISATTNVVTMAGSFSQTGYTNGAGNLARFGLPVANLGVGNFDVGGVCISGGTVFVADAGNERIRDITFNPQPQVVSGANLGISTFAGVTITGIVGRTYEIQSSPDLSTWTTVATVLLTSSPYLWIDQNPIAGNKFYQAVLLP